MNLDLMKLCKALLILHEGVRPTPYHCPAGKLTVGVGHNIEAWPLTDEIRKVCEIPLSWKSPTALSHAQLFNLLTYDLAQIIAAIKRKYEFFDKLDVIRQAVMVDMYFNLGGKAFSKFYNFLSALEEGQFKIAAFEMRNSRWYEQTKTRAERLHKMIETGLLPNEKVFVEFRVG